MTKTLESLSKLITELNTTNSSNMKKEILKKYPECKEILSYVYSPYKKFGITSKNCIKNPDLIIKNIHFHIYDLLEDLSLRKLTGHIAISTVNGFVSEHKEYKDLIFKIIDKNLKTRLDSKSINKVWPDTIPEFSVALAEDYKKFKDKISFEKELWFASRKLDGCVMYDTIVEFEDGKKLKIGEVVKNNIQGNIKSYNTKTKKIEFMPIKDWMKNGVDINNDNNGWYEVELENNEKIILTGNHRVWCDNLNCWRRTDELDGSEILLIS